MTTYRGHYLPVEARRAVLKVYRSRRKIGYPGSGRSMMPGEAIQSARDYFTSWLAHEAAYGGTQESAQWWTDRVRAADYYVERMYAKPLEFKWRGSAAFERDRARCA